MAEPRRPLTEVYWDAMMEESLELEPFLRRVAAGQWGGYSAAEIAAFLRQIEQDILGSITTKAGAMHASADEVEQRAEETRRTIEDLIRKYAR